MKLSDDYEVDDTETDFSVSEAEFGTMVIKSKSLPAVDPAPLLPLISESDDPFLEESFSGLPQAVVTEAGFMMKPVRNIRKSTFGAN